MPYRPVKLPDLWITLSDGKKLNLGGCILTFDPDVLDVEKARPAQSSPKERALLRIPLEKASPLKLRVTLPDIFSTLPDTIRADAGGENDGRERRRQVSDQVSDDALFEGIVGESHLPQVEKQWELAE